MKDEVDKGATPSRNIQIETVVLKNQTQDVGKYPQNAFFLSTLQIIQHILVYSRHFHNSIYF